MAITAWQCLRPSRSAKLQAAASVRASCEEKGHGPRNGPGQMGISLGDPQVAMDQMTMSFELPRVWLTLTNHPFWSILGEFKVPILGHTLQKLAEITKTDTKTARAIAEASQRSLNGPKNGRFTSRIHTTAWPTKQPPNKCNDLNVWPNTGWYVFLYINYH